MSGHSKWATTKRQKAVVDAKRSSLFTKLSKNISVAARDGVDPSMNFKLRVAIDKAKEASMPRENIERAVARGSGAGDGQQLERITYEGFGPGGIAVMVETVTDNKNRTAQEIKHVFTSHGGSFGSTNSVAWMFDMRGILHIDGKVSDEQELVLIDHGLVDMHRGDGSTTVITDLSALQAVKDQAEKMRLTVSEASSGYVAKESVQPADENAVTSLLDELDGLDDVDNIYTNADV